MASHRNELLWAAARAIMFVHLQNYVAWCDFGLERVHTIDVVEDYTQTRMPIPYDRRVNVKASPFSLELAYSAVERDPLRGPSLVVGQELLDRAVQPLRPRRP